MSDGWERGVVESRRRPASESSRARWSSSAAQNPMSSSGRRREAFQGQNGGVLADPAANELTRVGSLTVSRPTPAGSASGVHPRGSDRLQNLHPTREQLQYFRGMYVARPRRQFIFNAIPILPCRITVPTTQACQC